MTAQHEIDAGGTVESLLRDFIEAKMTLADGHSGDIYGSYRQIISDAKDRAVALGVEWADSLVPDYVRDLLRWDDDQQSGRRS